MSDTLTAYRKYEKRLTKRKTTKKKKRKVAHRPERDMAIHELLRAIRGMSPKDIAKGTYVSPSTIYRWRSGQTRYPSHHTMSAVAETVGYEYKLVKSNSIGNAMARLEEDDE